MLSSLFNSAQVPAERILTRYIAPFGLTALIRPAKTGEPTETPWVGNKRAGTAGPALFVSALDAEIHRLHSLQHGEMWEA